MLSGPERIIALLRTLNIFDQHPNKKKLISADYNIQYHDEDMNRMNLILGFINDNYKLQVHLEEVADLSGMTKNSFCRFFKQKTGRALTDFVTKLRISNAQNIFWEKHYKPTIIHYFILKPINNRYGLSKIYRPY